MQLAIEKEKAARRVEVSKNFNTFSCEYELSLENKSLTYTGREA